MLLTIGTLALLALFVATAILGASMSVRRRGRGRILGLILLLQALLALAAQVLLSTLPFGIGEPLIRVAFWRIVLQTISDLVAISVVAGFVIVVARWFGKKTQTGRRPRGLTVALLLAVP